MSLKSSRKRGIFKLELGCAAHSVFKLCGQVVCQPSNGASIGGPANLLQLTWNGRCMTILYIDRDIRERLKT
jgi:hypothetical protein